ncbi:MAG: toll/interleukin-1 receptor domain-containing protein, partial [Actinomadura rubrobrunea]|nr:toll/interleukin-1 receptor domain-containing protein [Actinomadura rubrobrunea]
MHGPVRPRDTGRMTPPSGPSGQDRPTDFFISYSPADERWAAWIAWQLETAGHRTMMQAWGGGPRPTGKDVMDPRRGGG